MKKMLQQKFFPSNLLTAVFITVFVFFSAPPFLFASENTSPAELGARVSGIFASYIPSFGQETVNFISSVGDVIALATREQFALTQADVVRAHEHVVLSTAFLSLSLRDFSSTAMSEVRKLFFSFPRIEVPQLRLTKIEFPEINIPNIFAFDFSFFSVKPLLATGNVFFAAKDALASTARNFYCAVSGIFSSSCAGKRSVIVEPEKVSPPAKDIKKSTAVRVTPHEPDESSLLQARIESLESDISRVTQQSSAAKPQPIVVERVIERAVPVFAPATVSVQQDNGLLSVLENKLREEIRSIKNLIPPAVYVIERQVALSQRIDQVRDATLTNITVSGVSGITDSDVPDSITLSNYLPLAGGVISGVFTTTDNVGVGTSTPYARLSVWSGGVSGGQAFEIVNNASTTLARVLDDGTAYFIGNVGIGTTSPFAKLSVAGDGFFDGDLTSTNLTATGTLSVTGQTTLGYASTTQIGSTDSAYFATSGGNVGIGTTTPGAKLSVEGAGIFDSYISADFFSATNTAATSTFSGGFVAGNNAALSVNQAATANSLYIAEDGNVGIGTTTPLSKLVVSGGQSIGANYNIAAPTNGLIVEGNVGIGTTTPSDAFALNGAAYLAPITSPGVTTDRLYNVGNDLYWAGSIIGGATTGQWTTDGTNAWRASGSVGIGTTTPGAKLSVEGAGIFDSYISADFFSATNTAATSTFSGGFVAGNNAALSVNQAATANSLYIAEDGNIGIGTTSPLSKLAVSGGQSIGANYNIAAPTNGLIVEGNVGIGTSSPVVALQVSGTNGFPAVSGTTQSGIMRLHSQNNSSSYSVLDFGSDNSSGTGWIQSSNGGFLSGNSALALNPNGGSVGIGTTSPYATLSLDGNAWLNSNSINLASTSATELTVNYLSAATSTIVDVQAYAWTIATSTSADPIFRIATDGVTATTSIAGAFDIDSGNLSYNPLTGITEIANINLGTQSFDADAGIVNWIDMPVTSSAVVGTQESYAAQLDGSPILTIYGESFGDGSVWNTAIGIGTTTPSARLQIAGIATTTFDSAPRLFDIASTSGDSFFTVTAGGLVGIGTTSPYATLSVDGTATFTQLINNGTGYYACVNTTSGELATSTTACGASSERFKENIADSIYGLEEVLKLRPVSFTFKKDFSPHDTGTKLGFIAEEVEKVIPEVVGYTDAGEIQNLDYPKLTAVLTKAVQELSESVSGGLANVREIILDTIRAAKGFFTELATEKLCVGDTCVTEAELRALLEKNGIAPVSKSSDQKSATSNASSEPTPDTKAPVVTILGANPSEIEIGAAYSDNGATVADDTSANLGLSITLDGIPAESIFIDTSVTGEHEIAYSAQDSAGNIGTAVRRVRVVTPSVTTAQIAGDGSVKSE